ncbi:hypothetical protein ABZ816_06125 [Actinosynnema sp. NPDC047251]|uniref:Putative membrane protein n=1 Tax=Saccharothrix espanaensis (strain ATCC 51144 / DSM 44229 / JCM 9112 / NBRC 15066 / NRRL 15764) TaxID=1179773 RepID=K0JSZ8_SACES|nr:hypothetical protein [Saccharothrix espanaensis]CCH27969.1 putative membrane protein [Saccharothrix espanaensis DSM 44229]
MSAAQLPHDMRGQPLCQHTRPGNCTWWCSYRRAVICITPVAVLILGGIGLLWATGNHDQAIQVFAGISLVLGFGIPAVIFANASSER